MNYEVIGDRATIASLIFEEQLMRGKDFTTETRRHGGFPQWVSGGTATWPGTAVSTAGGDPGPLNTNRNYPGVRKFKRLKAEGGRRKGYVGVPALAGLNSNREKATAQLLKQTTCNSNLYSFSLPPSAFSLLVF
jgi:hypothetical protein